MNQNTATQSTVTPDVDKRGLFGNLKHLFASSTSFAGELLQNGRRAGATHIDVSYVESDRRLTVTDNGRGIADFAVLVNLCRSGWPDEVQVQDRPFGMGLFSLFFAADSVVFRSDGKRLKVSAEDITGALPIQVVEDDQPVYQGTVIELHGLNFSGQQTYHLSEGGMEQIFKSLASGFAVPVSFNGKALDRPHALDQLSNAVQTTFGMAYLMGLHDGSDLLGIPSPQFYLQGLPLGNEYKDCKSVVHLDESRFFPRMPDRSHLYDHQDNLKVIVGEIQALCRDHLVRLSKVLPAKQFVQKYFSVCERLHCMDLIYVMDVVPVECFIRRRPAMLMENASQSVDDIAGNVLTREELEAGEYKVWWGLPLTTGGSMDAAAILRVAQGMNVLELNKDWPQDHWLMRLALHASALYLASYEPLNPGLSLPCDHVQVQAVQAVDLVLKSRNDPDFELRYREDQECIVVPMNLDGEGDIANDKCICFVTPNASERPTDVFNTFVDEYDHYLQDNFEREDQRWWQLFSVLRGVSLGSMINCSMESDRLVMTPDHMSQLAVFRGVQVYNHYHTGFRHVEEVPLDADFWKSVATHLGASTTPEQLRSAFFAAARPGEAQCKNETEALMRAVRVYTIPTELARQYLSVHDYILGKAMEHARITRAEWDAHDIVAKVALAQQAFGVA